MTGLRSLPNLIVVVLAGCNVESPAIDYMHAPAAARAKMADFPGERQLATAAPPPGSDKAMGRGMMGGAGGMMAGMMMGSGGTFSVSERAQAEAKAEPASAIPPAISRKIVYDAQVDLVVDSVDPVAKKVGALVQEARGYVAEQSVAGSPGSLRSMRWKVRVPVERFDSFVESIVSFGELERNNRTSQDVSEQYYDIEARIKNKRVEEQTLNKILQERSGKLEDVLKIEIELSRVRGEIEQLEGKIRVIENLSSLATLTLNVRERDKYAPPPPVVAGFSSQVTRAWDGSIQGLVDLGKFLILWIVSRVIYLPFWLIGGLLAWISLRILLRTVRRNLPRIVALARTPIFPPRTPPASG